MDASTVKTTLDGADVELVCTVEAMSVMSRAYGGMLPLYERVKALDFEAMVVAIRCGMMVDGADAEALPEKIFKTGLFELQTDVAEFVLLAASGGIRKDASEVDEEKPGKP